MVPASANAKRRDFVARKDLCDQSLWYPIVIPMDEIAQIKNVSAHINREGW